MKKSILLLFTASIIFASTNLFAAEVFKLKIHQTPGDQNTFVSYPERDLVRRAIIDARKSKFLPIITIIYGAPMQGVDYDKVAHLPFSLYGLRVMHIQMPLVFGEEVPELVMIKNFNQALSKIDNVLQVEISFVAAADSDFSFVFAYKLKR